MCTGKLVVRLQVHASMQVPFHEMFINNRVFERIARKIDETRVIDIDNIYEYTVIDNNQEYHKSC